MIASIRKNIKNYVKKVPIGLDLSIDEIQRNLFGTNNENEREMHPV